MLQAMMTSVKTPEKPKERKMCSWGQLQGEIEVRVEQVESSMEPKQTLWTIDVKI